jgi:hypothetical protein
LVRGEIFHFIRVVQNSDRGRRSHQIDLCPQVRLIHWEVQHAFARRCWGLAVVVIIAAGVYLFGGFYNVSAAVDDPDLMSWTLVHIREASINRRADATPPIKLDDPATIRQGAIEFAEHGCANCHGAPGVKWAKFSEGLNPGPPDLKESIERRGACARVLGG